MTFTDKLDMLMDRRNLNKHSLSSETGIPYTTIDNWYKRGVESVKLSTVKIIADYFGVTLDFFGDNNNNDRVSQLDQSQEFAYIDMNNTKKPPAEQNNRRLFKDNVSKNTVSLINMLSCLTADQKIDISLLTSFLTLNIDSLSYDRKVVVQMMLNSMLGSPLERGVPIHAAKSSVFSYYKGKIRGERKYYNPIIEDYENADFALLIDTDEYTPYCEKGDVVILHRQDAIATEDTGIFIENNKIQFFTALEPDTYIDEVLVEMEDEAIPFHLYRKDKKSIIWCFGKVLTIIKADDSCFDMVCDVVPY